jgi:hypothetical protein
MRKQAFQTLAGCTATFRFLEIEAEQKKDLQSSEILGWLKASVAMLDR